MKLMFLCRTFAAGKGGAERVATDVVNEMSNRGHQVFIGYLDNGNRPAYKVADAVQLAPWDRTKMTLASYRETVVSIDPDVFFSFYFSRQLIQDYKLVEGTGIPFGMQECTNPKRLVHNNWGRKLGVRPLEAAWERELIAASAARIRLTMPRYAKSFPDYIRPRVRAFSNPAFPAKKVADLSEASPTRKTIINIGGMKENKNAITLVRAFSRLADDFPQWDVRVFGEMPKEFGRYHKELFELIEVSGLKKRVFICGPTEDVSSEYSASQIHAIPSIEEGCPTCVLEAMAHGLPSVGLETCPGTNELIRNNENGLLVSGPDVVSNLESALRALMESEPLRRRFGAEALEDSAEFVPEKIYDQWEALLMEAASYKGDLQKLQTEQAQFDQERVFHLKRSLRNVLQ